MNDEPIESKTIGYAGMSIVNIVLSKKSPPGFLAITRDHGYLSVPGWVDMVPRSLPEPPKPSKSKKVRGKPKFRDQNLEERIQTS